MILFENKFETIAEEKSILNERLNVFLEEKRLEEEEKKNKLMLEASKKDALRLSKISMSSKKSTIISPTKFKKKNIKNEKLSIFMNKKFEEEDKMAFKKENQEKAFKFVEIYRKKVPKKFRNFIPLNIILK